jgi:RimJ/RimL family protein N-acetyltransferase
MTTTTTTAASPIERDVLLPDGRHLTLRPVCSQDEDDLFDLYDQLDADDRHRRFFFAYRPREPFFHDLANPAPGDGRLVLAVNEATGSRLIAEAGYCHLPNGNGELAMVVARRWRGWIGPWLLDALIDLAAANGVPNLEADVLAENGSMLALLRARGSVILNHDGYSTLRLMIGTTGPTPTWPAGTEPRILVETPGGRWPQHDDATALGLAVIACPGPSQQYPCPLLNGQRCPLAEDADAIVVRCPTGDAQWAELLAAHRTTSSDNVVVDDRHDHQTDPHALASIATIARHHAHRRTGPRRRRTDPDANRRPL